MPEGWWREAGMFTWYTGLYGDLTPSLKQAVEELTVDRYVNEVFRLDEHLELSEGLVAGTPAFHRRHAEMQSVVGRGLSEFDDHTHVSILYLEDAGGCTALASMRYQLGRRTAVPVAKSIGQADSSIPTHVLLQSFQYPRLPDFDADTVTEAQICEVSRLVAADQQLAARLVGSGAVARAEIRALLGSALSEMIVNFYRTDDIVPDVAGWMFNVKPKLALTLTRFAGLNLVPLYTHGVEPTEQALTSELDGPYFQRWHRELKSSMPTEIAHTGRLKAVRYLASRDLADWRHCGVSLPYLLVNNAEFGRAVDRLEGYLAQRPYSLSRARAYA
jgi:hypothetical protein